jgi:hypothetical protein
MHCSSNLLLSVTLFRRSSVMTVDLVSIHLTSFSPGEHTKKSLLSFLRAHRVTQRLDSDRDARILLSGTPGVGESFFTRFFVHRLFHPNPSSTENVPETILWGGLKGYNVIVSIIAGSSKSTWSKISSITFLRRIARVY